MPALYQNRAENFKKQRLSCPHPQAGRDFLRFGRRAFRYDPGTDPHFKKGRPLGHLSKPDPSDENTGILQSSDADL